MKTRQAVVIGSGVAGLATAIRLAKAGFSVQVFEKNSYPKTLIHYVFLACKEEVFI